MARINLLPWREELRNQKQQDFMMAIGAGVALTCFVFFLVYLQIEAMKEYQSRRNSILKNEIRLVDKKINEIKDIEAKKRKLLTKIEVIQRLQESRPQIVHLFDELAKSTPEGVFLSKFKQTGNTLLFSGKAQSNARVSAYMRGVEASPWLDSPVLQVITGKGKTKDGLLSDFSMAAKQGELKAEGKEGGKK
ncbi:MAG: PilN domain-containing protein [Methylococcaceae bacterium]|nr:PilN domain-containing protein [Methylococcaceae bacterium]